MEIKIPVINILDEELSNANDDDDDDVIIETRNQINQSDDIIFINEMPTTSQKSIENDSRPDFLSENPNINLDDYHEYLKNEKNKFLQEKQHESKLSNTVEPYMIDDAKV
jgi:hypothetical protein